MLEDRRKKLEEIIFEKYVNNQILLRDDMLYFISSLKGKIIRDRVVCIFNGDIDLKNVGDEELYWITKKIFEKYNDNDLIINDYFLDSEIPKYEKYVLIEEIEDTGRYLIFKNVTMTQLNRCWVCPIITPDDIKRMSDNTLVNYNKKTQRPMLTQRTPSGDIRKRVNVNKKSVAEMTQKMLKGDFEANELTFNILQTGKEHYTFKVQVFNQEKGAWEDKAMPEVGDIGDLIIKIDHADGKEVNQTDGFHRYSAILDAVNISKRQNKPFDLNMSARIHCMTEEEARAYIAQQNKQNKFTEEEKSYYDANNPYTIIVDDLNTKGLSNRNILLNRIGLNKEEVLMMGNFTTYDIMTNAIELEYDIKKSETNKRIRTSNYLTKTLSYIVGILTDDLSNEKVIEDRKENYRFEPELFYGYVHLAKLVQEHEDKDSIILEILDSINFNKQIGDFRNSGITNVKSNRFKKHMIQNINKVFDEKYNKVLSMIEVS